MSTYSDLKFLHKYFLGSIKEVLFYKTYKGDENFHRIVFVLKADYENMEFCEIEDSSCESFKEIINKQEIGCVIFKIKPYISKKFREYIDKKKELTKRPKINVGHNPKDPMSFEQAANLIAEKKHILKNDRESLTKNKEMPFTSVTSEGLMQYLCNAFHYLSKQEKRFMYTFIVLCQKGYSKADAYKEMAKALYKNISEEYINKVKNEERRILEKTYGQIANGIRLFG